MRISDWSSDVCSSDLVELAMQASYRVTGGDEFISIRADAKLRSSADGSTSWTDVAGSNAAVVDGWAYLHITPPKGWREQQGSVSINVTADSLPPGSYWFDRSEEHTSELQSLMRSSYAVFCLKKKNNNKTDNQS